MRLGTLVVVVVCGASACDDDAAPVPDFFADGQRLRAQYVEFRGGVRLFDGFFDTVLGEQCWFRGIGGPNGLDYCLPRSRSVFLPIVTNFADPACTVPTVSVLDTESIIVVVPGNACDAERMVFEVGPISQTHYVKSADGSCTETPGATYRRLGAPISLDTYVSAQREPGVTADRIGSLTLVGADGSRQVVAGWDTERQESVLYNAEVAPDRWSPRGVAYVDPDTFSDASCTRTVAHKVGFSAHCPITTVLTVSNDPNRPIYAAGARLDPQAVYRIDAGTCTAFADTYGNSLFVGVGEPIAVDVFAELRTVEQGSGRVRRRDAASPEGTAILPGYTPLFDTTTNQPCDVRTASDGVKRCLPQNVGELLFADAACTQPLVQVSNPPASFVSVMLSQVPDVSQWTYEVRAVGRLDTGDDVFVRHPSGCSSASRSDGSVYFFAGEPNVPTDFEAPVVHD